MYEVCVCWRALGRERERVCCCIKRMQRTLQFIFIDDVCVRLFTKLLIKLQKNINYVMSFYCQHVNGLCYIETYSIYVYPPDRRPCPFRLSLYGRDTIYSVAQYSAYE